jgi:hypothetical protein
MSMVKGCSTSPDTCLAAHGADAVQEILARREPRPTVGAIRRARLLLLFFAGETIARTAEGDDHGADRG